VSGTWEERSLMQDCRTCRVCTFDKPFVDAVEFRGVHNRHHVPSAAEAAL